MRRTLGSRSLIAVVVLAAASGLGACSSQPPPDPTQFGITVADAAPPPISGGTLIVSHDGHTAIAADPDRDRVWIVDLTTKQLEAEVVLNAHDEPGRVVEDDQGRVHVALRNAGAIATIDIASGTVIARTAVCPEPRGLAYDAKAGAIHVACESGDLVTLGLDGTETRRVSLGRDLRDVVVQGDQLLVSRFRAASVIAVDATGAAIQEVQAPGISAPQFNGTTDANGVAQNNFTPAVAWRMTSLADGSVAMVHQRGLIVPIQIAQPGGYGGTVGGGESCSSILHSAVTVFHPSVDPTVAPIADDSTNLVASSSIGGALPVDIAASPNGMLAIAMAGSDTVLVTNEMASSTSGSVNGCGDDAGHQVSGQPTAVAFDGLGNVIVQTREPAQILVLGSSTAIVLPGATMLDTGHELFHRPPAGPTASLACASCHPEGREDGRVWNFDPTGQGDPTKFQARRTQYLGGGVLATAPLHWNGDMKDLSDIMGEVFVKRMGGQLQGPRHVTVFANWIQTMRPITASSTAAADAIARGKQLFEDPTLGCTACHSGVRMTNDQTIDVGTGDHGPEAFQVPSLLGLGARAPYLHNGAALTVSDRFNPSIGGGEKHGHTSQLAQAQIGDLVAYLESL